MLQCIRHETNDNSNSPSVKNPKAIIELVTKHIDNIGVEVSLLSVLIGLATIDNENYDTVVSVVIDLLDKYVFNKNKKSKDLDDCVDIYNVMINEKEYTYHGILCPWLKLKALRLLQHYPRQIKEDRQRLTRLLQILHQIIETTEITSDVNRTNASYSIFFEAMNVIIHLDLHSHSTNAAYIVLQDKVIKKLIECIEINRIEKTEYINIRSVYVLF